MIFNLIYIAHGYMNEFLIIKCKILGWTSSFQTRFSDFFFFRFRDRQALEIVEHQLTIVRFQQMFSPLRPTCWAHPRTSRVPRREPSCYLCATCDSI